jgi:site-specific recombinase XerD
MSTIETTAEEKRQIELYREFMLDHEYTVQTAHGYSIYLSRYLRWLQRGWISQLNKDITVFLEEQQRISPKTYKECRAALHLYYRMINGEKFTKGEIIERNREIEKSLERFHDHSINIKQMKPVSVGWEVPYVRRFLEHSIGDNPFNVDNMTAYEIRKYLTDCLSHMEDSTKGRVITSIRNYFRFLKFKGIPVHDSIFKLPLSPAVWKKSAFPKTMDEKSFDSLHKIPDAGTPTGMRNRCIILCFTELALRCIEVAALSLNDFDWRGGTVSIKNTKNRSDRKLPVSEKLGQAFIEYIEKSRPKTESRNLFVRFKHSCGEPMGCSQIRGVIRRVYEKSGEKIESTGTHILRRTAATRIYNSGNSLKMTADILGHESLDSTVRYTKADAAQLRLVAPPWPMIAEKAGARREI